MLLAQRKRRQQLAGKIGHSDAEYEIGEGRSNNIFGPAPPVQQRNRFMPQPLPPLNYKAASPQVNAPLLPIERIDNNYIKNPIENNVYPQYNVGGGNGIEYTPRPMSFPSALPPLLPPLRPPLLSRPTAYAPRPSVVITDSPVARPPSVAPVPILASTPAPTVISVPLATPLLTPMAVPLSRRGRPGTLRHTPQPAHGVVPYEDFDPMDERRAARQAAIEIQEDNARLCELRRCRREEEKRREREEQREIELKEQVERELIGRTEQMAMRQESREPKYPTSQVQVPVGRTMSGSHVRRGRGLSSSQQSDVANGVNGCSNTSSAQLREDLRQQMEEKRRRDEEEARRRAEENARRSSHLEEWSKSLTTPMRNADAVAATEPSPEAPRPPSPIASHGSLLAAPPMVFRPMEFPAAPPLADLAPPTFVPPPETAPPYFSAATPGSGPQPATSAVQHQLRDIIAEHESLQRMLEKEVRRRPSSLAPLSGVATPEPRGTDISVIGVHAAPPLGPAAPTLTFPTVPVASSASVGDGEDLSAEPSQFIGAARRASGRPVVVG